MNKIIRYTVQMKNGSYMLQDFDDMTAGRVHVITVDNPIDSSLFKRKDVAQRCIEEILSGNTNLLVLYDEGNPPERVIELTIEWNQTV